VNPQVWHLDELSCIAANCLATTLELAGRDDEARQVLERTLAEHPHATRVRRHLLELHVKHGRRDEALAEFNQLPSNTPHREALRSAVRGACLAAKRNWLTARTYLDTAFQAGCRDLICLRWLVVTLLALGEIETSRLVIAAWRGIDPDGDEAEQYLREATGAELKSTSQNERRLRVDRGPASSSTAPSPNTARTKSDVNESRSS
jgi:predicted Zn-dependent protease